MRLASFATHRGDTVVGAALGLGDKVVLVDLRKAYEDFLTSQRREPTPSGMAGLRVPSDMHLFLEGGDESLAAAQSALDHARREFETGADRMREKGLIY